MTADVTQLPESTEVDQGRGEWLTPLSEGSAIRLSARLGVWGTLLGFGSFLAMGAGISLPLGAWEALVTMGFVGGGLGIAATAALVLRAARRVSPRVLIGALASLPLGLSIALVGSRVVFDAGLFDGLGQFAMYVIVLTTAVLGVVIGSGIWSVLMSQPEAEDDVG